MKKTCPQKGSKKRIEVHVEVRLDTTFAEPRLRPPPGRGAVAILPKISSHTHCPTATGKRPRKRSEGRGPAVGAKRREGLSIWLAAARAGGGQVKLGALHCRAASGQVVLPKGSERALVAHGARAPIPWGARPGGGSQGTSFNSWPRLLAARSS